MFAAAAAGCQQAATALGAVFQFFVRDILGMAGGIIFAYAAGAPKIIAQQLQLIVLAAIQRHNLGYTSGLTYSGGNWVLLGQRLQAITYIQCVAAGGNFDSNAKQWRLFAGEQAGQHIRACASQYMRGGVRPSSCVKCNA
jgi:hypothetical protein